MQNKMRKIIAVLIVSGCASGGVRAENAALDRVGTQWAPYIEWSLENPTFKGNPFDVIATATFIHEQSGEKRTTPMFYGGEDVWRFRFTGTHIGKWTFTTGSTDRELGGRRGSVLVEPNANSAITGFITHQGNKWARPMGQKRELRAFVPQLVMYADPKHFHNK
ncbi:MAG: hypothetical protein CMJ48_13815, partial [Planctomycetaceae bacterium]|nr:hypothetical protein [Planctomycetaceae bacterium]